MTPAAYCRERARWWRGEIDRMPDAPPSVSGAAQTAYAAEVDCDATKETIAELYDRAAATLEKKGGGQ